VEGISQVSLLFGLSVDIGSFNLYVSVHPVASYLLYFVVGVKVNCYMQIGGLAVVTLLCFTPSAFVALLTEIPVCFVCLPYILYLHFLLSIDIFPMTIAGPLSLGSTGNKHRLYFHFTNLILFCR
jgi:hypothetical protein